MVANIPTSYTRHEFIEEVCRLGCHNAFDFLLLSEKRGVNRGFAFMNCTSQSAAYRCFGLLAGHIWKKHQTAEVKAAVVRWAAIQGLEANLRRRQQTAAKVANKRQWLQRQLPQGQHGQRTL